MGEAIEHFLARTNTEKARHAIREMSEYELPIYHSAPTRISMLGKYVLALMVLGVHLLFYWGTGMDAPSGDDANAGLIFLHATVNILGISGFFLCMLILTKINHFMNFSTAGKWFTRALMLISITPGIFFLEEQVTEGVLSTVIGWVGTAPESFIPIDWSPSLYLIFGIGFSIFLVFLTEFYRKAFIYAITDKQVYMNKEFLRVLDSASHAISLDHVENLKVERGLVGRLANIGNVHMITASGMGLREDSVEVSGAAAAAALPDSKSSNPVFRVFKMLIAMMKFQRTRKAVDDNPEDCFFGVRNPVLVQKLVNELRTMPEDERAAISTRHAAAAAAESAEAAAPAATASDDSESTE
jgi:hypothetical protein